MSKRQIQILKAELNLFNEKPIVHFYKRIFFKSEDYININNVYNCISYFAYLKTIIKKENRTDFEIFEIVSNILFDDENGNQKIIDFLYDKLEYYKNEIINGEYKLLLVKHVIDLLKNINFIVFEEPDEKLNEIIEKIIVIYNNSLN